MVLADYPFLEVMGTMLVFFLWVAWFWILFDVWGDIMHRGDISGTAKIGWFVFTLILPFLGVFIYLASQNDGMFQRKRERAQARMDQYARATGSGGVADEIERAKRLLDSGALTQAEFDALKQKALAD